MGSSRRGASPNGQIMVDGGLGRGASRCEMSELSEAAEAAESSAVVTMRVDGVVVHIRWL